jgi:hypothetical protein
MHSLQGLACLGNTHQRPLASTPRAQLIAQRKMYASPEFRAHGVCLCCAMTAAVLHLGDFECSKTADQLCGAAKTLSGAVDIADTIGAIASLAPWLEQCSDVLGDIIVKVLRLSLGGVVMTSEVSEAWLAAVRAVSRPCSSCVSKEHNKDKAPL